MSHSQQKRYSWKKRDFQLMKLKDSVGVAGVTRPIRATDPIWIGKAEVNTRDEEKVAKMKRKGKVEQEEQEPEWRLWMKEKKQKD